MSRFKKSEYRTEARNRLVTRAKILVGCQAVACGTGGAHPCPKCRKPYCPACLEGHPRFCLGVGA